jgi:hypothetical protein
LRGLFRLSDQTIRQIDWKKQFAKALEHLRVEWDAALEDIPEYREPSQPARFDRVLVRGDLCMRASNSEGKLDPRWIGPWEVVQAISPHLVRIKQLGDGNIAVEHTSRVKYLAGDISEKLKQCAREQNQKFQAVNIKNIRKMDVIEVEVAWIKIHLYHLGSA